MRLLVRIALAVVANAVALLIAAVLLDGFSIDKTSFVFAVIVFSVVTSRRRNRAFGAAGREGDAAVPGEPAGTAGVASTTGQPGPDPHVSTRPDGQTKGDP